MPRPRRARTSERRDEIPPGFHERVVVGYHGCERAVARRVLLGEVELAPSENDYDWLGTGVYFWEHGLTRAREFAEEKRARGELDDPVVLGAYLRLGRCLDLTDTWATELLGGHYEGLCRRFAAARRRLPENELPGEGRGGWLLRPFDCALINFCATSPATTSGGPLDTVRGAFEEGEVVCPGAAVRKKSHVQIAVRNSACILGLFRPLGYTF